MDVNMHKFIFRMEVIETTLPKKLNWLGGHNETFDEDDFPVERYEIYFSTFEEMSVKIDGITEGYRQHWASIHDDMYGNNVEDLEYHNGTDEWDKEINIETSRLYLIDSLLNAIKHY